MRNHTVRFIIALLIAGVFVTIFIFRLDREAPAPTAPTVISAGNEFSTLRIADLRGRYVLVNFWDSENAVSRIASAEYDKWMRQHPSADFSLVQVNTDADPTLWGEIVSHDSLDPSTQFHMSLSEVKNARDYRPSEGHASYLVSPDGKIIARNPSVETLSKLVPGRRSLALKN